MWKANYSFIVIHEAPSEAPLLSQVRCRKCPGGKKKWQAALNMRGNHIGILVYKYNPCLGPTAHACWLVVISFLCRKKKIIVPSKLLSTSPAPCSLESASFCNYKKRKRNLWLFYHWAAWIHMGSILNSSSWNSNTVLNKGWRLKHRGVGRLHLVINRHFLSPTGWALWEGRQTDPVVTDPAVVYGRDTQVNGKASATAQRHD